MGAKCDYRALARTCGQTPRENDLVEELLSGRVIRTHMSEVSHRTIIGMAGLRYEFWLELYNRLRDKGMLFTVRTVDGRETYRMNFPGSTN